MSMRGRAGCKGCGGDVRSIQWEGAAVCGWVRGLYLAWAERGEVALS